MNEYIHKYLTIKEKKGMESNKRIIVSGGGGFIGSHLCERLIQAGNDVTCIDNFISGNRRNIEHLLDEPRFHLVEHDVIDPICIEADEIYNLACPASPIHYQNDPIHTAKTSFMGALNMLGVAKKNGAKILQASTSEVYGDPEVHPQKENYKGNVNPNGVRSCYDEGKRVAESLFFDYRRMHHVQIKVIRIFNTYGPKMAVDDGRVISNFIVQALKNEDVTVYGDGMQTRSFCYVDDLLDAMVGLMGTPEFFTGPMNAGNPHEVPMIELARQVIEMTNSKSKIVFAPLPQDDPRNRKPDITLAQTILNWEPKVSIREGLEKTIRYFDELLSETNG